MTDTRTSTGQRDTMTPALWPSVPPEEIDAMLQRYLEAEASAMIVPRGKHEDPRCRVVVGVDDSAGSRLAVERGAAEADLRSWPLRIVHVEEPGSRWRQEGLRFTGRLLLAEAEQRARQILRDLPVTAALKSGAPVHELISVSGEAGLVVIGATRRAGLVDMLSGSVAAQLARNAAAPVLIARAPATPATAWKSRSIVVGVDGSVGSAAAFAFAVAEARLTGVGLTVVHVCAKPDDFDEDPLFSGVMAGVGDRCLGVPIRRQQIVGDPRTALVELSTHASAVVVGAYGLDRSRRLRTTSVADSLVRHAFGPLFVVHGGTGTNW